MNDPKRWLVDDNLPGPIRDLIEAGDPAPSVPSSSTNQLAAFCQALLAQGTATATGVFGFKVVATALVAGAALSAGLFWVVTPAALRSRTDVLPSATPRTRGNVTTPAVAAAPSPVVRPATSAPSTATKNRRIQSPPAESAPSVPIRRVTAKSGPPVAAFPDPAMSAEAALLERARAALSGNPERALQLAEEHRRRYPSGSLTVERELIAIDALQRMGRREEAQRRAAPFLRDSTNLYGRRVRDILSG